MHRILAGLHRVVKYAVDLLPNLVFEKLGHAAIRSGSVVSIPSLNVTPVMTLAR